MSERQLEFRVGIFVIVAVGLACALVFQFSRLRTLWQPRYTVTIHFDEAPGVYPATPVRRSGVAIGSVREISFDEERGGVVVEVEIRQEFKLAEDTRPRLVRSLLGDATIEMVSGTSPTMLRPGARLEGESPGDPMQFVERMERQVVVSLESFNATSAEWRRVGGNLNGLLETNRGNLDAVVERAAESLHEFTLTMRNANQTLSHANEVVGDPRNQENLRKTLAELPEMVRETRQAIAATRLAVEKADENLENLRDATEPLARRTASVVTRLDNTLANLESLSGELKVFTQLATRDDGSLRQFVGDPDLYRNLNRSAASLAVLLKNMEPVVHDLRIFADKVARHPELIGVSGAFRGSSGLKDPPDDDPFRQTRPPLRERNERR
jgi:phospholipid/cholesterol/gamma-HCH transport system substrate-binding protein